MERAVMLVIMRVDPFLSIFRGIYQYKVGSFYEKFEETIPCSGLAPATMLFKDAFHGLPSTPFAGKSRRLEPTLHFDPSTWQAGFLATVPSARACAMVCIPDGGLAYLIALEGPADSANVAVSIKTYAQNPTTRYTTTHHDTGLKMPCKVVANMMQ